MNPKIAKPVAHISLDFSMQDKERLTDKVMVSIALKYMQKMGYENTQYIIVRHHDTDHPHIHQTSPKEIELIQTNGVACKLHVLQRKKQPRNSS
ncbi:hypothetical protein EZS27_026671 [termite gut metagenome]|uniref:MobA/VirD2-like nuclease domain-containing protein n=1 Tax=termite gut metagenome TaxID=433724 RepID=A0A5J4QSL2_9ZZZZ